MKITIVGESPQSPTGFGTQTKHLGEAFQSLGRVVSYVSATSSSLQEVVPDPLVNEWRLDNFYNPEMLEAAIVSTNPDAVLLFRDISLHVAASKMRSLFAFCPVFIWLAEEGDKISEKVETLYRIFPENCLIPLTEATQNRVPNCGPVIPHGLPMDRYVCPRDRQDLRYDWSKKLGVRLFPDEPIIINVDRNAVWKNWDLSLDFLSRVDARMIIHAKRGPSKTCPYDLETLAKMYNVQDRVIFTDVKWAKGYSIEDMIELYSLSDVSLSMSSGEGFGLGALEAAALGIPQIVSEYACAKEIVPEEYVVPTSGRRVIGEKLWRIPSVDWMVQAYIDLMYYSDTDLRGSNNPEVAADYQKVARKKFDITEIANSFLDVFEMAREDTSWRKKYRGGIFKDNNFHYFNVLSAGVHKLAKSVFQPKAWDGQFILRCLERGLQARGMEDEILPENLRLQTAITFGRLDENWPTTEAIVLTDCVDYLFSMYNKEFTILIDRLKKYDWVFMRNNPEYVKGGGIANRHSLKILLEATGKVRRNDMEDVVKNHKGLESFDHEIWAVPALETS